MIVAVDLHRRGIGWRVEGLVVKVEVGFAEPAALHHHFVPAVDLHAVLREVVHAPQRAPGAVDPGRCTSVHPTTRVEIKLAIICQLVFML